MVVVRSPVRSCVRSVVRDVFGVVDGQTDLQRILALSPSLLVWPANGAGWQGTSGGTLAASGQPLGLGVDLAALGGKTLSEWLATAPELVTNGGFASNVDGWGDLGSWTAGSVAWSASGAVVTVSSFQGAAQQVSTSALNKVFVLSFDVVTTGNVGRVYAGNAANPSGSPSLNAGTLAAGSYTYVFQSGYANLAIGLSSTSGSGDVVYDNISVRELPGNHLRAGTWASPSDAARASYVIQTDPALYNVSGQPELVTNGAFATDTDWAKGTGVTISSGILTADSTFVGTIASQTSLSAVVGKAYRITYDVVAVTNVSGGVSARFGGVNGAANTTTGTFTEIIVATNTDGFAFVKRGATTWAGSIDNISVKEIPASQYKYALSFGGVDDYYSLLNAISITTDMTVIRAFKRASAGITSIGLATAAAGEAHESNWITDNKTYARPWLSGTGSSLASASASTATGSFVDTLLRNGTTTKVRRLGAEIISGATPGLAGNFSTVGRASTTYNSGEISFLAVFPSELTGANLALVEQIAAATNGAVLA